MPGQSHSPSVVSSVAGPFRRAEDAQMMMMWGFMSSDVEDSQSMDLYIIGPCPEVFCLFLFCFFTVQEQCESRGSRPGLSVLTSLMVSVDVK